MLLQFGMNSVVNNLVTLIGAGIDCHEISGKDDLRKRFIEFLDVLQPRKLSRKADGLDFLVNSEKARVLGAYFSNDSMLDDKEQSRIIFREKCIFAEERISLIKRGLDKLNILRTGHHDLIDCVITDIFVLPSEQARAGSTSQAVGVIWFNPKLSYESCDVVEMIVHELTHQLMFIDELRWPHYNYPALLSEKCWPTSAILNTRRPFDKVLHSAVVAMEVLLLRRNYIGILRSRRCIRRREFCRINCLIPLGQWMRLLKEIKIFLWVGVMK